MKKPPKQLKITAVPVADAARMLASASGKPITQQQVQTIAERGDLISPDGTINLLEYIAFLVREMAHGTD